MRQRQSGESKHRPSFWTCGVMLPCFPGLSLSSSSMSWGINPLLVSGEAGEPFFSRFCRFMIHWNRTGLSIFFPWDSSILQVPWSHQNVFQGHCHLDSLVEIWCSIASSCCEVDFSLCLPLLDHLLQVFQCRGCIRLVPVCCLIATK